ncbi:SGNH/GDSL hydrolase family protein [Candidatus Omnitrophota bacterium]
MNRKKNIVGNALLVISSTLFCLLAAEAIIRVIDPAPKMLQNLDLDQYILSKNPILKYEYIPGAYIKSFKSTVNSMGFRDYEFPQEKPPRTIRIIVLGDSITAGMYITDTNKTYPKLLEKLLNEVSSGYSYEVFNMGVGGYDTLQEVETLRTKGLRYNPDIVIIGFCLNDFWPSTDGGLYKRLVENLNEEELATFKRMYKTPWRALLNRSRLLFFLYHRIAAMRPDASKKQFAWEHDYTLHDQAPPWEGPVWTGLTLLHKLQKKHAFKSYLFVFPVINEEWSSYQEKHNVLHRAVLATAIQCHPELQVIDLWNDFASLSSRGNKFAGAKGIDPVHFNELGHQAAAELMAKKIKSDLESIEKDR